MPFTAARARRKVDGQVDVEHLLPVLVLQRNEQVVLGDAGVGDQDVELAQRLLGVRDQRLDRILVGEIAGQHRRAAELGGERLEHLAARAGHRDLRALRVQRARDRAADAAGRAGDERGLAGQIEHAAPLRAARVSRARRLERRDILRRADRRAGRALGDALEQAGQHLAGADLVERLHALRPPCRPRIRASAPCR